MLEPLYKYVTISGLINILEKGKLKWSAPRTFNDPFDLQPDFLDYDLDDFRSIAEEKIYQIIFGTKKPPEGVNQVFLTMRRKRINNSSISKKSLKSEIQKICDRMINKELEWRKGPKKDIGLGKARVLCLSEIHNDILMWGHYTNNHKGGTLKFKSGKDLVLDNVEIHPISYREERPTKDFPSRFLDGVLGISKTLDITKYLYVKSLHWEYEHEWRLLRMASNEDEAEFHNFPPKVLKEIYLGCKISQEDKLKVKDLLIDKFSHVKVFQASTNYERFELDFSPVQ